MHENTILTLLLGIFIGYWLRPIKNKPIRVPKFRYQMPSMIMPEAAPVGARMEESVLHRGGRTEKIDPEHAEALYAAVHAGEEHVEGLEYDQQFWEE
jgi:hypothetical protein